MTDQERKVLQQAVRDYKQRIDHQIESYIRHGLIDGSITESDFEKTDGGELHFRLYDQHGALIVYNVTQNRLHSYGGNLNQDILQSPNSD